MKKHLLLWVAVIALGMVFTSCNKADNEIPADAVMTSEDLTTSMDIFQSTEDEIDTELESRGPNGPNDCPTVTVTPGDWSFPRTVTIDYGTDGCEGPDGRVRRGQIIVTQSDTLRNAGAVRTATLVDFYVDDAHVEGTKTWTNQGFDANGDPVINRTVTGGSITFPDGSQITWEADHTITLIEGAGTPVLLDDVVQITGGSNGVNRNGVAYSFVIDEQDPLVKRRLCRWVESGTLEMTVGNITRLINYGNGTCDPYAILTLENGNTRTIHVRAWWRP